MSSLFQHHILGVSDPIHPLRRCIACLYSVGFGYDRIARMIHRNRKWVHIGVKMAIKNGWAVKAFHAQPKRIPRPSQRKRYVKKTRFKYSDDTIYRKKYLRRKVWCWFKFGLYPKSAPALVGCSREQFIQHIKSQFQQGMSVKNYGKFWEIDHKVPCREFDLSIREEQLKCFHFSNLRPLRTHENRSRKAREESVQTELTVSFVN